MKKPQILSVLVIAFILVVAGYYIVFQNASRPAAQVGNANQTLMNQNENANTGAAVNDAMNENNNAVVNTNTSPPALVSPLENALSRVTKKPFGIKISPTNSPVVPERFSGYHTGVDFETFADEQEKVVTVYVMCSGELLVKKYASGYGGVVVQSCTLEGQDVTIVYGHVKLSSITKNVGDQIIAGERLGVLGAGFSTDTDFERKHLHLGIHKGTSINIKGYVQTFAELADWIDAIKFL